MIAPNLLAEVESTMISSPPVPVSEHESDVAMRVPSRAAKNVLSGTSTLGISICIERGAGFVANILAARFGGAPTFGAYSLAIGTANNISTYAAGGIGATAARFSGKYPYRTAGYGTLAQALGVVSLLSAVFAAIALWAGAAPIAHLLHKESLTGLLRWAAISAAGIIMLECARGFFVGQRRLAALVLLSLLVGVGLLSLLPWTAATHSPARMIVAQGAITLTAVTVCVLLAKPLRLLNHHAREEGLPLRAMLKEVWGFGLIQLAGLVGANVSGWWLTALVARSDTTLVQMSYFAIASQLRNLSGLAPGMLTEGSYAVMADPSEEHLRTPHRVMALCTFAATVAALVFAGAGMLLVPWGLRHLYGPNYRGAGLTACVGLATAVVHMGNAPAAARLSIVSIRAAGVVNTLWAGAVAVCATVLLLHGGSAALAMGIFFGAHVLSATLVLAMLARKDHIPAGLLRLFVLSTASALLLVLLAVLRERLPASSTDVSLLLLLVWAVCIAGLVFLARRYGWLPTSAGIQKLLFALRPATGRLFQSRKERVAHGS